MNYCEKRGLAMTVKAPSLGTEDDRRPVAVSALVAKYGGDEEQQIAALLHDVLEDGGQEYELDVARFGERVLAIVKGCTDGVPNAAGEKADWLVRKTAYLKHLAHAPDDTLLVSGCDKLHNATAVLEDLREVGADVFERFRAKPGQTLWYYESLARIFTDRGVSIAPELARVVRDILVAAAPIQPTPGSGN